jgi:hypothetical protein
MSDELIRMDKEYTTRDGRAVRVLTVDGKSSPVIGEVYHPGYGWCLFNWDCFGKYQVHGETQSDLIPKPVKHTRTVWLNLYDTYVMGHYTRQAAGAARLCDIIACKEITFEFEEGEGL